MKRRLDEVLSQQDSVAGPVDGEEVSQPQPLPLDTQINIIEEEVGSRHGTSIRGNKSPKRFRRCISRFTVCFILVYDIIY